MVTLFFHKNKQDMKARVGDILPGGVGGGFSLASKFGLGSKKSEGRKDGGSAGTRKTPEQVQI